MPNFKIEQRINIKFLVKLKYSAQESFNMLKEVYGADCLSKSQAFEWHKKFRDGWESVEDGPRPGRPSTARSEENIERVRQIMEDNPTLSIKAISRMIELPNESVRRIVKELRGDSWVPERPPKKLKIENCEEFKD
ncbi:protein GVQW3-like [Lutzomyia longipalpis]|nr:protein GVQW3-like [Lutzomyia longipalpis]